eukprot:g9046.t1
MELTSIDITDKNSPQPTEKGEKGEEKEKTPPPTEEEKKAANRIFKFWKRRKILKKWWRAEEELRINKKKRFANGVLVVIFLLQVVSGLVRYYMKYTFFGVVTGFDMYLVLLVWAAMLPLNSGNWQVKVGIIVSFLHTIIHNLIIGKTSNVAVVFSLTCFGATFSWLLSAMAQTLKYNYSNDVHALSARLSTKIIAGLPFVCYLAMAYISSEISFDSIENNVCPYIPSAYKVNNYTREDTIIKSKWMHCVEHFAKYYPDLPKTVNEVMLEQGIQKYAANQLKYWHSFQQMLELILLILTSQVLLRVCRLTVNDILSVNISGWELLLSIITLFRVALIFITEGLSLESVSYSQLWTLFWLSVTIVWCCMFIALFLIIKLVRDATLVIQLEKDMLRKEKTKQKKHSASVEMIHKRSRRFSSMQSNRSFMGEDIV